MKKSQLTALLLLTASSLAFSQNVGIGLTNPDASALLDLNPPNNDKGLLLPRLTESERDGISNPAESLLIFNTDSQCYEGYSIDKNRWFTAFGCLEEVSKTTDSFVICGDTLTDIRDDNRYRTVQIGDQCWMAENLRYLPSVVDPTIGDEVHPYTIPYYYVHGYYGTNVDDAKNYVWDPSYVGLSSYTILGVYYNWVAAMQSCPDGWHVPSGAEWCKLESEVGGGGVSCGIGYRETTGKEVGKKLKARETDTWIPANWPWSSNWIDGTDDYRFTALPGFIRNSSGFTTAYQGLVQYWWTSTENGSANAYYRMIAANNNGMYNSTSNKSAMGYHVRCIQD